MHKSKDYHTHTLPGFGLDIPIFQKLYDFYKNLTQVISVFPKNKRYTLGQKLDQTTLEIIQQVISAGYLPKEQKLPVLEKSLVDVDLLKVLTRLAKDVKALDSKKYLELEQSLQEIGRMLGGWKRSLR